MATEAEHGRLLGLAPHERFAVRISAPSAQPQSLLFLAGGPWSRQGTGDLALSGHAGRPGGVIGLAHRPFENRDRQGVRPPPGQCASLVSPGMDLLLLVAARPDCSGGNRMVASSPRAGWRGGGRKSSLAPAVAPARDPGIVFTCIRDHVLPAPPSGDFVLWWDLVLEPSAGVAGAHRGRTRSSIDRRPERLSRRLAQGVGRF